MKNAGITLIALIITIIILLILAGVTISALSGENGILENAIRAKEQTEQAKLQEKEMLSNIEDKMSSIVVSENGYDEEAGTTTPKIVHPGFTWGNTQLNGIWVAKFEASGTNSSGVTVGNRSYESNIETTADSTTFVKILPSVISLLL